MKTSVIALLTLTVAAPALFAAETPEASLVKKGEYVARAGDCVACHTAKHGQSFAGGLPMETPIGIIYTTNITPDPDTGIGRYSFEQFDQAVRHGIAANGDSLYPAMPYPSYARITDEDMQALYAYFMKGVPAVQQPNHPSDIPWPLSMRWPLAAWRWMFAPAVVPTTAKVSTDPVTARGAYLVEGLGHCGTCHTPRAITMQEKALDDDESLHYLAGGAPLEGWVAKNLRGDNDDGLGRWSEADLVQFFRTGRNDFSAAFGGMSEVVEHSLQHLSDDDLTAIARYLKQLPPSRPSGASAEQAKQVVSEPTSNTLHNLQVADNLGARVYADNCMACHRSDGKGYAQTFPALGQNGVVNTQDATSTVRIILGGYTLPGTQTAPTSYTMPGFGWRLNDEEVAAVATFIQKGWGNHGIAVKPGDVAKVRQSLPADMLETADFDRHEGAVLSRGVQ
ncbi:c-type cytochrome [Pseudomonas sp. KnCO4]|uniref:c-type cytochrome n=1 Tax=Pseudomonas sp. KnCO4 TaxID=3381355 RepID=UPI0038782073